jgi:uncharacterized oligopeptide transporter (OPT) family protein
MSHDHKPFIADQKIIPEFTFGPVLMGILLGILFGASSLYLGLKVGMTVSASVPIAVMSITIFRAFGLRISLRRSFSKQFISARKCLAKKPCSGFKVAILTLSIMRLANSGVQALRQAHDSTYSLQKSDFLALQYR